MRQQVLHSGDPSPHFRQRIPHHRIEVLPKPRTTMIVESSLLAANWKLASGGLAVVLLAAADAVTPPQSIEDYSIKALMGIVIIFVVRLLLTQQKEHKQELKDEREHNRTEAAQREEKMVTAMTKQAEALERVADQTEEQTTYFKTVTRGIVDEHLKGPRTPLP